MCVFFCLCNTGLCHMICCKPLTECIGYGNLRECHKFIRDRRIIIGKAYKGCLNSCTSVKSLEIIIAEASGDLSCTVRTEVEENNRVFIFDGCNRSTVFHNYGWFYELICLILVIGLLNCFRSTYSGLSLAFCQCIIC